MLTFESILQIERACQYCLKGEENVDLDTGQGVGGYAGNRVTIDVLPRGPLTLLIIRSITIKQGIHTDGPENWPDSQLVMRRILDQFDPFPISPPKWQQGGSV